VTRVPEVKREDLLPEQQAIHDEIEGSRGWVPPPFKALLNSPEVALRIARTGAYIRFGSTLPAEVIELAVLATARELDCQYEWTAHDHHARRAGVRDEAIEAIRDRRAPQGLTPDEALVVSYAQELLGSHRVSEPTFQAAVERFGAQALTDLTATIGHFCLMACVLNAFDVQPDAPLLPV